MDIFNIEIHANTVNKSIQNRIGTFSELTQNRNEEHTTKEMGNFAITERFEIEESNSQIDQQNLENYIAEEEAHTWEPTSSWDVQVNEKVDEKTVQ